MQPQRAVEILWKGVGTVRLQEEQTEWEALLYAPDATAPKRAEMGFRHANKTNKVQSTTGSQQKLPNTKSPGHTEWFLPPGLHMNESQNQRKPHKKLSQCQLFWNWGKGLFVSLFVCEIGSYTVV